MTAILDIDVLRTHAVSVIAPAGLGRMSSGPGRNREPMRLRPVLAMRWQVTRDGRLTCRWQTDASAAFGLPPD